MADNKAGIISFELKDIHPHDIGSILVRECIAVRVGHHCAQPLMDWFGITGTVRASLGIYNNEDDKEGYYSKVVPERVIKEIDSHKKSPHKKWDASTNNINEIINVQVAFSKKSVVF